MRFFSGLNLFFLIALGACGPVAESTYYTAPVSPEGRLCVAHCGDRHLACHSDCDLQNRACLNKVQGQALIDYERYTSEQFLHATAIEFSVSDFERLQPCEDEYKVCAAACDAPYHVCYTQCGGAVEVR